MESSTVESDMAKLFYFKGLIKKIQAKRAKQVSLDDLYIQNYNVMLVLYKMTNYETQNYMMLQFQFSYYHI